jgi:F-type H+-transporting ATPase subunit gamma
MPSLLDVRKKIESTKNTQKITKAMQLVAASKMKHFQKSAAATRAYATDIRQALASVGVNSSVELPKEGYTLFVLLTSDKGLCGAMNAQIVRALGEYEPWRALSDSERKVVALGRKASEAVRRLNWPLLVSHENVPEKLDSLQAWGLISELLEPWDKGACRAVHVIAPDHVSAFVYHVRPRQYLPAASSPELESSPQAHLVEPSRPVVAQALARRVLEAEFMEAFAHLKATEYSSRMVAMKKATDAAVEQTKILTSVYNKARQAKITQELAELAAASEAMS